MARLIAVLCLSRMKRDLIWNGRTLAPRSRLPKKFWPTFGASVLSMARVGIDDNYFELGGDSIRSIQVLAQAKASRA